MIDKSLEGKRAALYIRVSTEEQALRGYSLEAQLADLEEFAKENFMIIVGRYIDAGTTARKKLKNRKEFQRMLEDVQANKIDVILFIKLDRWFRNVADYYEVQKILDAHNVTWKCTQEFYDTTTANGRLNLNIKLSIAQDESDRTSERIKFVFENKLKNGEVVSGSLQYGFYIKEENGKKIVAIDKEKMKIVEDAFEYFRSCHSLRKTCTYIYEKYNISWLIKTFARMIRNDMYAGIHRGNEHFCEAAFSLEYMQELRALIKKQNFTRKNMYCYIFSGLIICGDCGKHMSGCYSNSNKKKIFYYRCNRAILKASLCKNSKLVNEKKIEQYLLNNIKNIMNDAIIEYDISKKNNLKPQRDRQKIKNKMKKLKDLYVNDLIDLDEYRKDYADYQNQLKKIDSENESEFNVQRLKELMNTDFLHAYQTLDREHKRVFWRSIIKEIHLSSTGEIIRIVFL